MQRILEYVRTGGGLTDDELAALINERMLRIPARTQRNWLRQLLLALDGYGGAQHLGPSEKVKNVVQRLETGLPSPSLAPAGGTPIAFGLPPKE